MTDRVSLDPLEATRVEAARLHVLLLLLLLLLYPLLRQPPDLNLNLLSSFISFTS